MTSMADDEDPGASEEAVGGVRGCIVSCHIVLERADGADSIQHLVTGEVVKLPFNTGVVCGAHGIQVSPKRPPIRSVA